MRYFTELSVLLMLLGCAGNATADLDDFERDYRQGMVYGEIGGLTDRTIRLYELYGNSVNQIDSSVASPEGFFEFDFSSERNCGIYRFGISERPLPGTERAVEKYFDIIWDGETVVFKTHFNSPHDSMVIIYSENNRLYYQFKRKLNEYDQKIYALDYSLLHYPSDERFYNRLERQYRRLLNRRLNYIDNLIKNNGESVFARIAFFMHPPRFTSLDETGRLRDLRSCFFLEGQFSDPVILQTDLVPAKISQFFDLYHAVSDLGPVESMVEASDIVLERASENKEVYEFVLEYLIERFRHEDMKPVAEHIKNRHACDREYGTP